MNTQMVARLIGNDKFFVPNVTTKDEFVAAIPKECPLGVALSGGGTVEIHGVRFIVPSLPMKRLTVEPVEGDRNKKGVVGLVARLPEFLAYLQLRFERPNWNPGEEVMRTTYADFLMNDITRFVEENVMLVRMRGLQAHASTDLRLEWNEVGISPNAAKALLTWLGTDSEVRRTPDGLVCLVMRFPIAGPEGIRKVVLRILPELPDTMIAMHPLALQEKHQGDTDGDVLFLAFPWRARYVVPRHVGRYPKIEMLDGRSPLEELFANHKMTSKEDAVHQVMGARIKKITGLLVYSGYCLSRAYEVALGDRKKAIEDVASVFVVLVETVMDAKKTLVDMEPLYRLADGLKEFANGGCLDSTIFHPFLPSEELRERIDQIGRTVGSMETVRANLMGVLVASGRKRKGGVLRVITALLEKGVEPKDILATILDDAQLKKLVEMEVGDNDERRTVEEENKPVFKIDTERVKEEKGVLQAFLAITCNGVPVFEKVRLEKRNDGRKVVVAFVNPVWLDNKGFRWRVEVEVPFAQPVGNDGHFHVWMAGRTRRFFRPRLALVDGEVMEQGVMRLLQEALLEGVSVLPERKIRSINSGKLVESVIQQAIVHAVNSLPVSSPTADRVYRGEWDVVIPEELSIVEGWRVMETILRKAAGLLDDKEEEEDEFNVQATRKGKPGKVITKVGEQGVPDYLLRMNPFARYLPGKRIVETREFAMSLPFANPEPLPLTTGGYPLDKEEVKHLTPLTVAVFDNNLNVWGETHHDTMLACPSLKKKTALEQITISCPNLQSLEMVRERLAQQNITNFSIVESPTDLGDGLEGIAYQVVLHGPIEDIGKMKSFGKLKAVPVLIPHQLFSVNKKGERREIDGVFSRRTFVDGGCLDAALYMAVSKERKGEVDPAWDARLEDIPDAMETIVAVYDDGTEEVLGEAFVGTLPFFRPQQTGIGLFHLRSGSRGIKVPHFALPLVGIDQERLVMKSVHEEVGRFIQCWKETVGGSSPEPSSEDRELELHKMFAGYGS